MEASKQVETGAIDFGECPRRPCRLVLSLAGVKTMSPRQKKSMSRMKISAATVRPRNKPLAKEERGIIEFMKFVAAQPMGVGAPGGALRVVK